jgi:very-short-patch-repair endonuclease
MHIVYYPDIEINNVPQHIFERQNSLLINQSVPELWMQWALGSNNISYSRQYIISYMESSIPQYQYLDFYIPLHRIAIEIDGSQHFQQNTIQNSLDKQKNDWCIHYNIPLIRIKTHFFNMGNQTEMAIWAKNIADPSFQFNYLQYGSGFGFPLTQIYMR